MAKTLRMFGLLVAVALFSLPAPARDRFDEIRARIRSALVEQSVPSVAVSVVKDGKIVWEEGFGWADRERRIPATAQTMYTLASNTKPIAATGLMTLVRDKQLDLDKPVNDYLGSAKLVARVGDAREATVRKVANHTSGLPIHWRFIYEQDNKPGELSMDETILHYGNLVTAPGEKYEYSNLGYGVLGYVMERLSGKSFGDFMRQEVFVPLGMTRTSVDVEPDLRDYVARRYDAKGAPLPFYGDDCPASASILSSAHDMARFALFHLKAHLADQKAILPDALIDEMHRETTGMAEAKQPGVDFRAEEEGYGVGFFITRDYHGYRLVAHAGGNPGMTTLMVLVPAEKLGVVVLTNLSTRLPVDITDQILATYLPKWQAGYIPGSRFFGKGDSGAFKPPQPILGTWRGSLTTYKGELPLELDFLPTGEVHAKLGDQLTALVNHAAIDNGYFTGWFIGRIGTPDTDGYWMGGANSDYSSPYTIQLSLKLRDEVLNGAATVAGIPQVPIHNGLSHWVAVKKSP